LDYLVAGYQREANRLDEEIAAWERQFSADDPLLGYRAPKWPLQLAAVAAYLYEQFGEVHYAQQARDVLLRYREFATRYQATEAGARPEYSQGVPPLDAVFDPILFGPACLRIAPTLDIRDTQALAAIAADSLRLIWLFPEWGGHNRAMLRAASLAACAEAFPQHPDAPAWIEMSEELAEESWGRWSVEDTMMYPAHWLRALIVYAGMRRRLAEFIQFIQPRLYLRSIVQMLSPLGILPDYGDSHWMMHSHWEWMSLLEWGAGIYQDPTMKWAASRIWKVQRQEIPSIYASQALMMCHAWCSDEVAASQPGDVLDALDDVILKKMVFRTGWGEQDSYACINYRDEGDYGRVARDYLRTNLAVSAEKMHHGHADEGSFAMLVHNQTLLLHESGYRENPPDGVYRADMYHNRVVWRPNALLPGAWDWNTLVDNGHYKPVRTDRLYQTRLLGVEIGRMRVVDENQRLGWDRTIFFLSEIPCWVVVDALLSNQSQPRHCGLVWWTTDVLDKDRRWLKTHLAGIQRWRNESRSALWMMIPEIPGQGLKFFLVTARRSFQDEIAITNIWSGEHRAGRSLNFITMLVPRPYQEALDGDRFAVQVLPGFPSGKGYGVRFSHQGESITLATLNDLAAGFVQEDIRPRYSAEQGWYKVGEMASDAAFSILREGPEGVRVGLINGTRLEVKDHLVYQAPSHAMFQEDRGFLAGIPARFRWQGRV
jgi:hypothetical protein